MAFPVMHGGNARTARVWVFLPFFFAVMLSMSCGQKASDSTGTPHTPASERASAEEVMKRLDHVRAIGAAPIPKDTEPLNRELDAIGKYLVRHATTARPILRREIESELAKPSPSHFFLLDMGFAAERLGEEDAALKALLRLDTEDDKVAHSHTELFFFTHSFARKGRQEISPVIERIVLDAGRPAFVPQHMLELDPTLQGAFLYGALGPDSEERLLALLEKRPERAKRILEVLNWLGTAQSVPGVLSALKTHPDLETLQRAVGVMMRVGGPKGRDALLAVDRHALEPAARDYLAEISDKIAQVSFESLRKALGGESGPEKLSDAEIRQRLDRMEKTLGVDSETHPVALLDSTIPSGELISRLVNVRSRMLHRVSDEALSDVEITNVLINALAYRDTR